MQFSNLLLKYRDYLLQEMQTLERQINKFPPGKLTCNKNSNGSKTYHKWYKVIPDEQNPRKRKRIYISKSNRRTASVLFQRQICELRYKELQNELSSVEAYLKKHHDDKTLDRLLLLPHYQELLDDRSSKLLLKVLSRPFSAAILPSSEEFPENSNKETKSYLKDSILRQQQLSLQSELAAWAASDYPKNPFFPEKKKIPAVNKLMVRSKSEAIIALMLNMNRIPFRYDALLSIGGYNYYPDFTIRHPITGATYYWEHVGMLDKPDYVSDHLSKIRTYLNNGIYPDINLIMTYETGDNPIDSNIVYDKISEFFL